MPLAAPDMHDDKDGKKFGLMKILQGTTTLFPVFFPGDRSLWIMPRLPLEPNPRLLHTQIFRHIENRRS